LGGRADAQTFLFSLFSDRRTGLSRDNSAAAIGSRARRCDQRAFWFRIGLVTACHQGPRIIQRAEGRPENIVDRLVHQGGLGPAGPFAGARGQATMARSLGSHCSGQNHRGGVCSGPKANIANPAIRSTRLGGKGATYGRRTRRACISSFSLLMRRLEGDSVAQRTEDGEGLPKNRPGRH